MKGGIERRRRKTGRRVNSGGGGGESTKTMICKEEVFVWFKNLCCTRRIEVMHGLLSMCVPLELRFLATCVEDLCRKDFLHFGVIEGKANSTTTATSSTSETTNDLSDHVNRARLITYLALLHSTNRTSANAIFSVLAGENGVSKGVATAADEIILLLTLSYFHPAFTFEQKDLILSRLNYYQFAIQESASQDCNHHDIDRCCPSDFCYDDNDDDDEEEDDDEDNCSGFTESPVTGCAVSSSPLPHSDFSGPSGLEEEIVEDVGQPVVPTMATTSNTTSLPPSHLSLNVCGGNSAVSSSPSSSSCATKPSSSNNAQLPRGSNSSRTSTGLPNASSSFKAHIKHLELKSMQRKRKMDYRIQVTWANGEVTEVTKSHQELYNFHQQLVHFLPDDGNVHRQDRRIPYFTGPKQLVGTRTDELTDDSITRMADYLRQLMVKVPNHILDSDLVTSFFRMSNESRPASEGDGHPSMSPPPSATSSSSSSSSSSSTVPLPTSAHVLSQIQQQTSQFSSSSSSSTSSDMLPSSPPPNVPPPHCLDGTNNLLMVTTVNSSHVQNDLSPPSQQLKSLTIYNSLRPDGHSSSYQRASAPSQQTSFSTTTGTTTMITGNPGMRHSQHVRQSPKPVSFQQHHQQPRASAPEDDFLVGMFHREKLTRIFDHLRKKYSYKELIELTEDDLKNEGIPIHKIKQTMKIFEVLKCQIPNGVTSRPLLDLPPMTAAVNPTSNHFHHPNTMSTAPPPVIPQSQVMYQPPACCTVHTCQTQVYMPTVPVDLLVRYSAPIVASDLSKPSLQSVTSPTVPSSVPISASVSGTLCNGELSGNVEPVDLVSPSELTNDAGFDKASDFTHDNKLRRSGRSGNGGALPAVKMASKGKPVVDGVVRKLSNVSLPTTLVGRQNAEEDALCDREMRTSSPMIGEGGFSQNPSHGVNSTGRSGGVHVRISCSDEANQQPPQPSTNNPPRKMSPYQIHQQQPPPQVSLSLVGLNVHQQRVSNRGPAATCPSANHCQNTGPNTRGSATPPPVAQAPPPPMPYSFVPLPIGGVFSTFPGSAGPAFLSPHSNGFVPTPTIPPPNYQFVHSPDGLVQADYAAYSQMTSLLQQQSGMPGVQQRLPPPPSTIPGFVAGPTPNVGFHGNQLQSPPPSIGPPNCNTMPNHVSLVGLGPPPNMNVRAKLTCYNCGLSGHQGSECSDVSVDDLNKVSGQFQLSFMPAVKPLDDCD